MQHQHYYLQGMSWMLYAQSIRYTQSRPTSYFVGTERSLGAVYGFDAKYVAGYWSFHMSFGTRREAIFLTGTIGFKRYFQSAAVCWGSQRCYKPTKHILYLAHDTFPSRTPARDLERGAVAHPRVVGKDSVAGTHFTAQCEHLYDSTTVKINIRGGVG
jgi:hypothetical protein